MRRVNVVQEKINSREEQVNLERSQTVVPTSQNSFFYQNHPAFDVTIMDSSRLKSEKNEIRMPERGNSSVFSHAYSIQSRAQEYEKKQNYNNTCKDQNVLSSKEFQFLTVQICRNELSLAKSQKGVLEVTLVDLGNAFIPR
ncbi:hypothetical protein AVEN_29365-1 [Araneus ventricosus]|uniref:Uncharacterized protein n=1 Tax=Araneus ventricosus TaxID=182803 RepID=A0A4Y2WH51_ARAVE|nr:hypothetical protein AVEN_29365-1 [Araneus ventricosus]